MFSLGVMAPALIALATTGCGATLSGEQDATVHLQLPRKPDSSLFYHNEITVGGNINSVGPATLLAVTLSLEPPILAPDLSFISTLEGQAVTATKNTPVATLTASTRGQQSVSLHIDYFSDLHPLFENSTTIKIVWTGTTDPAFTGWPADGSPINVRGDIKINIQ
jgi:hypothetical protein